MNKRGFTLIEVLVVIALLGVLLLLVVPNLTKVFSKSVKNTMKIQENEMKDAGILYLEDFCKNPLPNKECPNTITKGENKKYNGYISLDDLVNNEYMDEVSLDGSKCKGCIIYTDNKAEAYITCDNYETPADIHFQSRCNIK